MPDERSVTKNLLSTSNTTTFGHRREDIFKRLRERVDQCKLNYDGKKELASDKNDSAVSELCEALEETFSYGLRQQQVTAASILQNMQEIVGVTSASSNSVNNGDTTFWDFCQAHLIPHERQRYEELKHVWTKCGRGKAFIRATLNEGSLPRYLMTWLANDELLQKYYTGWSLLLDNEKAKKLPGIVGSLGNVLFALTVDSVELNAPSRALPNVLTKEEPIIYAPTPAAPKDEKRRNTTVERPIESAKTSEDLIASIQQIDLSLNAQIKVATSIDETFRPPDPIEPELEFLKHPLPDYRPSDVLNSGEPCGDLNDNDDKSDTSSQYSKTSSANLSTANDSALEQKYREMSDRCSLLQTQVAKLSRENRLLERRLQRCFLGSGIDPSSSLASNFLITIPHVKLVKPPRGGSTYYTYEIHITFRTLEHWSVLRRYRDFHKLHKSLLKTHPVVCTIELPPKKHFGNKDTVFVEERRQQLQIYLLNLAETIPQIEACKSKAELQKVFPFLRER